MSLPVETANNSNADASCQKYVFEIQTCRCMKVQNMREPMIINPSTIHTYSYQNSLKISVKNILVTITKFYILEF